MRPSLIWPWFLPHLIAHTSPNAEQTCSALRLNTLSFYPGYLHMLFPLPGLLLPLLFHSWHLAFRFQRKCHQFKEVLSDYFSYCTHSFLVALFPIIFFSMALILFNEHL